MPQRVKHRKKSMSSSDTNETSLNASHIWKNHLNIRENCIYDPEAFIALHKTNKTTFPPMCNKYRVPPNHAWVKPIEVVMRIVKVLSRSLPECQQGSLWRGKDSI